METNQQSTKALLKKHLNLEGSEKSKRDLDYTDSEKGFIRTVWSHPIGKVVVLSGGAVIFLFAAGGFFRLLAWTMSGYYEFDAARNKK